MEDEFKGLVYSHGAPCDVIRKCMPELVWRLNLECAMDHIMSTELLTNDAVADLGGL